MLEPALARRQNQIRIRLLILEAIRVNYGFITASEGVVPIGSARGIEGIQERREQAAERLFSPGAYVSVAWNPAGGPSRRGIRRAVLF